MTRSAPRPGGPLRRLGRLLLGRNELRRAADRIEAAVIVFLAAAFLTAVAAATCLAGHLYQSEHTAAARLRPTAAVLSQPGPGAATTTADTTATTGASWRLPNRTERSGALTTQTAPAIYYAPAGTEVQIWLNRSGEPVAPPPTSEDMILTALCAGFTIAVAAAVAFIICYRLCRMALDRHRLTRWESAWAAVGPHWTSHR
jgi:hypothetical protein